MTNPVRFRKIDDSNRGDHFYLEQNDVCFFLYEYTPGEELAVGSTNSLIMNLKKSPLLIGQAQYQYKAPAIRTCAKALGKAINSEWLAAGSLVPVPPSKDETEPEYDDRMFQVCKQIPHSNPVDVRKIVVQTESMEPFHRDDKKRLSIDELAAIYKINEEGLLEFPPTDIAIVDDVLTTGTHFKAMKKVLSERFPAVRIAGFFIARRVPQDQGPSDIFDQKM